MYVHTGPSHSVQVSLHCFFYVNHNSAINSMIVRMRCPVCNSLQFSVQHCLYTDLCARCMWWMVRSCCTIFCILYFVFCILYFVFCICTLILFTAVCKLHVVNSVQVVRARAHLSRSSLLSQILLLLPPLIDSKSFTNHTKMSITQSFTASHSDVQSVNRTCKAI